MRSPALAALLAAALPLLAGCTSEEAGPARDAARRFEQALAGDSQAACALLAPRTREAVEEASRQDCPAALRSQGLKISGEVSEAEVAGHSARVRAGEDTLFLVLLEDGWRVHAAGCSAAGEDPEIPYECSVKAG